MLDVKAERIEVFREPSPDGYASVDVVGRGGSVSPSAFPDVSVAVDDVLL